MDWSIHKFTDWPISVPEWLVVADCGDWSQPCYCQSVKHIPLIQHSFKPQPSLIPLLLHRICPPNIKMWKITTSCCQLKPCQCSYVSLLQAATPRFLCRISPLISLFTDNPAWYHRVRKHSWGSGDSKDVFTPLGSFNGFCKVTWHYISALWVTGQQWVFAEGQKPWGRDEGSPRKALALCINGG